MGEAEDVLDSARRVSIERVDIDELPNESHTAAEAFEFGTVIEIVALASLGLLGLAILAVGSSS